MFPGESKGNIAKKRAKENILSRNQVYMLPGQRVYLQVQSYHNFVRTVPCRALFWRFCTNFNNVNIGWVIFIICSEVSIKIPKKLTSLTLFWDLRRSRLTNSTHLVPILSSLISIFHRNLLQILEITRCHPLHKKLHNTGFHWPIFIRISTESMILFQRENTGQWRPVFSHILGSDSNKGYIGPNWVNKFFLSFHFLISICVCLMSKILQRKKHE